MCMELKVIQKSYKRKSLEIDEQSRNSDFPMANLFQNYNNQNSVGIGIKTYRPLD